METMETAPKDGTDILVLCANGYAVARWNNSVRGPGASEHIQREGWVASVDGKEVEDEGWDTGHGFTMQIDPLKWSSLPPL